MTVQPLRVGGTKFVIVKEKDFRDLKQRAAKNGRAKPASRVDARDRADVKLALQRLSDPNERPIPYERVRKELGLE